MPDIETTELSQRAQDVGLAIARDRKITKDKAFLLMIETAAMVYRLEGEKPLEYDVEINNNRR